MLFHEIQHPGSWWLWAIGIGVGIPLFVGAAVLWRVARRSESRGLRAVLLVCAACTFSSGVAPTAFIAMLGMTTDVGDAGLRVTISPFLLEDTIGFDAITSVQVRRYDPIREYGGWGIRVGRRGRAYNMTGDRGVQLELRDAPPLLVGSQRPEELAEAIATKRRESLAP